MLPRRAHFPLLSRTAANVSSICRVQGNAGPACHEGKAVLYAARRVAQTGRRLAGLLRRSALYAEDAMLKAGLGRKWGFRVTLTTSYLSDNRWGRGNLQRIGLACFTPVVKQPPHERRTLPRAPDAPHLQAPCEYLQASFSMLPHQVYLLWPGLRPKVGMASLARHETGPPTQPRAGERGPDKKNAGITPIQSTRRCPIA